MDNQSADWSEIISTIISALCHNTPVTPQQMQIGVDFARKLIPDTQANYMTMAKDIIKHDFNSESVYNVVFAQRWISGVLINVPCPDYIQSIVQNITKQLITINVSVMTDEDANKYTPYLPVIMPHIQQLYSVGQMTELRENYDPSNYRLSCSLNIDNLIVSCLWIARAPNASTLNDISVSLPVPSGPNMEVNLSSD